MIDLIHSVYLTWKSFFHTDELFLLGSAEFLKAGVIAFIARKWHKVKRGEWWEKKDITGVQKLIPVQAWIVVVDWRMDMLIKLTTTDKNDPLKEDASDGSTNSGYNARNNLMVMVHKSER